MVVVVDCEPLSSPLWQARYFIFIFYKTLLNITANNLLRKSREGNTSNLTLEYAAFLSSLKLLLWFIMCGHFDCNSWGTILSMLSQFCHFVATYLALAISLLLLNSPSLSEISDAQLQTFFTSSSCCFGDSELIHGSVRRPYHLSQHC